MHARPICTPLRARSPVLLESARVHRPAPLGGSRSASNHLPPRALVTRACDDHLILPALLTPCRSATAPRTPTERVLPMPTISQWTSADGPWTRYAHPPWAKCAALGLATGARASAALTALTWSAGR